VNESIVTNISHAFNRYDGRVENLVHIAALCVNDFLPSSPSAERRRMHRR
jgi:hypothetical protein